MHQQPENPLAGNLQALSTIQSRRNKNRNMVGGGVATVHYWLSLLRESACNNM